MTEIHDAWPYDKERIEHEDWCTGSTMFDIIRPRPAPGQVWQNGSTWQAQKDR